MSGDVVAGAIAALIVLGLAAGVFLLVFGLLKQWSEK